MKNMSSLQSKKFYRVKKPAREFLCALCSAPRQTRYSKNLSLMNYLQVLLVSATAIYFLYPLMGLKASFLFFPVWLCFELSNKLLYRKELPCPYCGFDPTWYRRDVRVANKMVKDFWQSNFPDLVQKKQELNGESSKEAVAEQAPTTIADYENFDSTAHS